MTKPEGESGPSPVDPPGPTEASTAADTPGTAWLVAFFALAVVTAAAAVLMPEQNESQQFYFRLILSISIAGVAAIIPGFFSIEMTWLRTTVRGGGAIGVFLFIYAVNPASVSPSHEPTVDLSGDWGFFVNMEDDEQPLGVARIEHPRGENVFTISGTVTVDPEVHRMQTAIITFESEFAMVTNDRIIFHYRNNLREEGVAVANYVGDSVSELDFVFNDYSATDIDGSPSGILRFRRVVDPGDGQ